MKNIAVYGGSFDPPTLGHIDVVKRVYANFDEIHVVVAVNSNKKGFFEPHERVALLEKALADLVQKGRVKVKSHQGLLVGYCAKVGAKILIRGLRAVSDFEAELQMASMNRRLAPKIETFHVMTDEKFLFVSSSLIKEIAEHGVSLSDLVPAGVEAALKNKFQKLKKTKKTEK
jgi:pantetheine-phosphate adenylyltransferase